MSNIKTTTINKLLKISGVKRTTPSAKKKLAEVLENIAVDIIKKADKTSKNNKRQTIKGVDILKVKVSDEK